MIFSSPFFRAAISWVGLPPISSFASHDLLWQNGQSNLSWSFVRCKRPPPQYLASTCNHLGKEMWNGRTDFSHSSEKNDPKRIPLETVFACLFMTRLFARSSYPKNRRIPSHMELLQRTKYLKFPCYLCWYTKSWMVKLTLSLHQSNIQHLPKWMASKSSTQLMKESG